MFNVVLWSLDHMDGSNFEKLCTDLMSRSGYPDIIPVGGMHDRGRDAQAIRYTSSGEKQVILFQFSLNKSWNKKLSDEIKKIRDNKRQVTSFVFVTSQTVTGAAQDKFELLANEYGWDLQIYDRTWLRLQLEERHLDLAKKYLAIPDALLSNRPQDTILSFSSCENSDTSSWLLYKNKKYEEAALGFKKWLTQYPKDILAWQGLASCYYRVYQLA